MHWLGYDIAIAVKVGGNILVVTVKINYMAYVQKTAPKCRIFCFLARQIFPVTTVAACFGC
jgi:hypothetical protein